jgi:hypothetical protein
MGCTITQVVGECGIDNAWTEGIKRAIRLAEERERASLLALDAKFRDEVEEIHRRGTALRQKYAGFVFEYSHFILMLAHMTRAVLIAVCKVSSITVVWIDVGTSFGVASKVRKANDIIQAFISAGIANQCRSGTSGATR